MTRIRAAVLIVSALVAAMSSGGVVAGVRSRARVMGVVVNSLPDLESLHIEAPGPMRVNQLYRLTLVASIPSTVALRLKDDAGFDLTTGVQRGRDTDMGEFSPDMVRIDTQPPSAVIMTSCTFGLREREGYEVFWLVTVVPKRIGPSLAKFQIGTNDSASPVMVQVVDDSAFTKALNKIDPTPALLWLVVVITLIASDLWLVLLSGAVGIVLCTEFGIGWTAFSLTGSSFVLLVNRVRRQSLVGAIMSWFAAEIASESESDGGIDHLHDRAEKMAGDAMRRAHWELGVGIVAAIAGFAALVPLYHHLAELPDADVEAGPAAIKLSGAALPWLLLFGALLVGARFFLMQHRQSLDDHRHFEEKLRDREWIRFLLKAGDLSDRFKELLLKRVAGDRSIEQPGSE